MINTGRSFNGKTAKPRCWLYRLVIVSLLAYEIGYPMVGMVFGFIILRAAFYVSIKLLLAGGSDHKGE